MYILLLLLIKQVGAWYENEEVKWSLLFRVAGSRVQCFCVIVDIAATGPLGVLVTCIALGRLVSFRQTEACSDITYK